ncbi:hypothetical protein [Acuticoccus sediminis]|uniref:hypothetical protein n=1 Tax=Acuticoccus sediminis TaxID=2184697 RepID=UPI001CFC47C8|nr:hypothetical protein [Acuticoccus sediminis]
MASMTGETDRGRSLWADVLARLQARRAERRRRRAFEALRNAPGWQLDDLGVTLADIQLSAAWPLSEDGLAATAERIRRRRQADRTLALRSWTSPRREPAAAKRSEQGTVSESAALAGPDRVAAPSRPTAQDALAGAGPDDRDELRTALRAA